MRDHPKPRITVVTVTYGDRRLYLNQTLAALSKSASLVCDLIIVDNGSEIVTLDMVPHEIREKTRLIVLGRNTGSACGFATGIEYALRNDAELILLLDDDNVLEPLGLAKLLATYEALGAERWNVLTCFRLDRKEYRLAAREGRMISNYSSFLGFNLLERIIRKVRLGRNKHPSLPLVPCDRAPYGGTMFHADLVAAAGLPNTELFLYFDDHEFFSRIKDYGARIFLCTYIAIIDVDKSWNRISRRGHYLFSSCSSEDKSYYLVRNEVYLAHRRGITPFFILNIIIYISLSMTKTLIAERSPRALIRRSRALWQAFLAGLAGRLGERRTRETS